MKLLGHAVFTAEPFVLKDGTPGAVLRITYPDLPGGEIEIGFSLETFGHLVADIVTPALMTAVYAAVAQDYETTTGPGKVGAS